MPFHNPDLGIMLIVVLWLIGILVALFSKDPNKPK